METKLQSLACEKKMNIRGLVNDDDVLIQS